MLTERRVAAILEAVTAWVESRDDIAIAALIGSWARGEARPDSDLDLMILTPVPATFRDDTTWVNEIDWRSAQSELIGWEDVDYGAVWSRHIALAPFAEVEISFGLPSWADADPPDPASLQIVRGGCRVLSDPTGLFAALLTVAEAKR